MLASQSMSEVIQFRGAQEELEIVSLLIGDFVALWHHSKERIDGLRYLVLRPRDGDYITGLLSARKINLAVPFFFKILDFGHPSNELAMVESVDDNGFGDELGVLS